MNLPLAVVVHMNFASWSRRGADGPSVESSGADGLGSYASWQLPIRLRWSNIALSESCPSIASAG